jgi:hypothetical protein
MRVAANGPERAARSERSGVSVSAQRSEVACRAAHASRRERSGASSEERAQWSERKRAAKRSRGQVPRERVGANGTERAAKSERSGVSVSARRSEVAAGDRARQVLERYRSGRNGGASKASCPKGHVGSNPTLSAKLSSFESRRYRRANFSRVLYVSLVSISATSRARISARIRTSDVAILTSGWSFHPPRQASLAFLGATFTQAGALPR